LAANISKSLLFKYANTDIIRGFLKKVEFFKLPVEKIRKRDII